MAVAILLVAIGVILQGALLDAFVADDKLLWPSLLLSGLFLIQYGKWSYRYNTGRNRKRFVSFWRNLSIWRRAVAIVGMPTLVFLLIWINLSHTLPALYTLAFGAEVEFRDIGERSSGSAKSGCRYRIDLQRRNGALFCYAVAREQYAKLPRGLFPVVVRARRSPLGVHVLSIRPVSEREWARKPDLADG